MSKKQIIDVSGVITKENEKEISEQEYNDFIDGLLDYVESKGYMFGGGFSLLTEEEYLDEEQ